ncbi:hypothetical protein SNEBB_008729 [Seison nebaliae]|nr:hypothetical protein SNEBB_008729 [Seison nebaliae]
MFFLMTVTLEMDHGYNECFHQSSTNERNGGGVRPSDMKYYQLTSKENNVQYASTTTMSRDQHNLDQFRLESIVTICVCNGNCRLNNSEDGGRGGGGMFS